MAQTKPVPNTPETSNKPSITKANQNKDNKIKDKPDKNTAKATIDETKKILPTKPNAIAPTPKSTTILPNTTAMPKSTKPLPTISNKKASNEPNTKAPSVESQPFKNRDTSLIRIKTMTGNLSPKSVVHNGNGLFFAQNMMYNHTISIYNRQFVLLKTIKDQVKLSDYGIANTNGLYKGAPVEAAFSHNGNYAWVSNYRMYGDGFTENLGDNCPMSDKYENSYVYGINTQTFGIEKVIAVGSVPKYVATTPDNRYVLVSNWCSGDLSIIDINTNAEIKRITVGAHPRGIVVDAQSRYAYIAIMGGSSIVVLDLQNLSTSRISNIGITPRHLCLSPDGQYLYVTLNNEGKVGKIDLQTRSLVAKIRSGKAPRSMVLSADGRYLYVVNYNDSNISKIETKDMSVLQKIKSPLHPIGITIDNSNQQIWVACYSGAIAVYQDRRLGQNIQVDNEIIAQQTNNSTKQDSKTSNTNINNQQAKQANNKHTTIAAPKPNIQPAMNIPKKEQESFFGELKNTLLSFFYTKNEPLPHTKKSYRIIIASFNEQSKYKIPDFTKKATQKGLQPELINEQKIGRYRLVCGNYQQRSDAEKALDQIRCHYPDAWILW